MYIVGGLAVLLLIAVVAYDFWFWSQTRNWPRWPKGGWWRILAGVALGATAIFDVAEYWVKTRWRWKK